MKHDIQTRNIAKQNPKPAKSQSISIFPKQITFQEVQSHSCYQIPLYIRNQGKENQRIRIIQPITKHFKIKIDENYTKTLAPGLTIKLNIIFVSERIGEQIYFQDNITVISETFKQTVSLKAFTPREKFIIPKQWNLGRMLVNKQNIGMVPVRNEGKKEGIIYCEMPLAQITQLNTFQLRMEPGDCKKIELLIKSKRLGEFKEVLVFSNGHKCVAKGVIVEENVQIIGENGQKFNIVDLGPLFIGEKIEKSFIIVNNTINQVQSIFKTFNKNIELNQLKIDSTRGNFIIKSPPQQYAKQLRSSYTSTLLQKCTIPKFQQSQNTLIIQRCPNDKQCKLFQLHANGHNLHEIHQQPVIQSLIVKHSNTNAFVKIPIKFISVFPRVRISHQVLQFGEIKERTDYTRELMIHNEGKRDVLMSSENMDGVRVEMSSIVKAHSSQTVKITLRMVKSGQYAETIKINIFDGLFLEVKVFAQCRASSIRAKKLVNMNSARELRTGVSPLYRTLGSPTNLQLMNSSSMMNKTTDLLSQIRTNRLNKLLNQHIETEKQPSLKEPNLSLRFENLDSHMKSTKILRKPKIQAIKPTRKQISTIGHELSKQQLQKIVIEGSQIAFGTIFISTELTRQVKITNNNSMAILFQWQFSHNQCLQNSNRDLVKIQGNSQKIFRICFKPNSLGAVSIPFQYIINRNHIFQISLTAFVTLINVEISTKALDFNFSSLQYAFEKAKTVEIQNKSNEGVTCLLKFLENKHFHVSKQQVKLEPFTNEIIQVIYRPQDGDQSGLQRLDIDKLTIRVVGGAENTIKCIGQVNDAKVTIKQSEISYPLQLVSSLLSGKINLKNHSKIQTIVKIQFGSDLAGILSFQKQMLLLGCEQKREIGYTIICNQAKNINSYLAIRVRGSKTIKIPVEINMIFPQIAVSRKIIDFGNIPIMGNNYQQTVTITNLFKSELRLQYSKKFDNEDYIIEIKQLYRSKTQISLLEFDLKVKKKQSNYRQQNKKIINSKVFKLLPNSQTTYEIKFIPKKIQSFDVAIPLKLCGTSSFVLEPIGVRLVCNAIEPVVYLHPHHISFDTRIIGEGKSNNSRSFQIKNPHQFGIDWYIEPQQLEKCDYFYLSEDKGHLNAKQTVYIDVMFKPQQQGHFFEKMNVVLKQKKISHISLQLQGNAILPSIKFNCNQLLMPIAPLGIESKSILVLENHGYDAITITKWKTSSHFQSVDVGVNFIQGKLLSLAKKDLKVEVCIISSLPVSLTTFLEFYDQFGNKYEVPVSFTCDNSIMTTYSYLQQKNNVVMLDKKENCVKICSKTMSFYQKSASLSASQIAGCQFIKNWLNYEINLTIKSFPQCFIDSEGEFLFRMINRMSGMDLVKRFENSSELSSYGLYGYYCECIKILKIQGAFLNQIRPEYLLSYKNYKAYLNSKNRIVQQQCNFQVISTGAWVTIFYQLCKLFIMPNLTDKIINKFINLPQSISSTIYSTQELLIFKFLNSFNNNEPFYDLGEQIKFFQIFQKSFQQTLGLNFSQQMQSLQITSVVVTPSLYMILISKFLYEKLSYYGLCQFLTENDLFSLSSKQLMLTMTSFITNLYHYVNSSNICFQATIGDKITKIIDIQNPTNRRIKYRLCLLGSSQFNMDESMISLGSKGKSQVRISYHCKQNKQQQAKLLLIPQKEDNYVALPQPLSFKLITSILSKITLKKMQVNARLYEVTNIVLEVQLPMDIIDFCQFSVSLIQEEQNEQSFFCFGQMNRILRNNHDKLQIKLIPLTLQAKFSRVCYKSSAFGEFNFEITAKIQPTSPIPEIKLKQLKVNKQEVVSIFIPKQNELLQAALRFMNDHHIKSDLLTTKKTIPTNKYSISIVQSSYIAIHNEYAQISRASIEGKENIRVDLMCSFVKPYSDYSCTMMVKNDVLKDVRFYKISASIAMKPKIIPMSIRTRALEPITFKIPIKIAPCQCYIENACEQLSITNFTPSFKQNADLIAIFTPDWIMQKEVSLIIENMETLEQIIYLINLKADEPTSFDNIRLQGSAIFSKRVKIPISLFLNQELKIECLSKRVILQDSRINPIQKKWTYAKILPCKQEEMSSLKLKKQRNNHYFWASLFISNRSLSKKICVTLEEKPNIELKYLLSQLPLGVDCQIIFDEVSYLSYKAVKKEGIMYVQLTFSPNKQMVVSHTFYAMIDQEEYAIEVTCKSPALPPISFPEIISCNLESKTSLLHLINPSESKGIYHAKIQPSGIFEIDNEEIQFKGKEKRQIKIYFHPKSLQTRYKAVLKFQSETLPTYLYNLNGISEFQSEQKVIQCPIYFDREVLTDIQFTNHFSKHQQFLILQNFEGSPFELAQPKGKNLSLQAGASKKMIIKSKKTDINGFVEGLLEIKLGERKWRYRLVPIVIKNFSNRKHLWTCKARETCYENLQLPPHFQLKSLESSPQISPYLSFSVEEGTNNLKLKYSPLKPLPKQQFTVYLLGEKEKYALNCIINVAQPEFDDTILIKTKEINEVGCVLFKLTNIKKQSVPFKAYFIKGQPDFTIEIQKNILQGYGRPGTPIKVKFASNVYNKRVDDELWIQTHQMLWRFKVKGIVSKKIQAK